MHEIQNNNNNDILKLFCQKQTELLNGEDLQCLENFDSDDAVKCILSRNEFDSNIKKLIRNLVPNTLKVCDHEFFKKA